MCFIDFLCFQVHPCRRRVSDCPLPLVHRFAGNKVRQNASLILKISKDVRRFRISSFICLYFSVQHRGVRGRFSDAAGAVAVAAGAGPHQVGGGIHQLVPPHENQANTPHTDHRTFTKKFVILPFFKCNVLAQLLDVRRLEFEDRSATLKSLALPHLSNIDCISPFLIVQVLLDHHVMNGHSCII